MTPNTYLSNNFKKIPKHMIMAFLYTILFGIICHFYMLTNKLTNHDDIQQLYNIMDLRISGRWFLQYAASISSYFSMPWVNGSLIILYTSFTSAFIADLFEFKKPLQIILLSAFMIFFPSHAAIFPYMNSADAYALAGLLSVLGAYLYVKNKFGFIFLPILTLLSLAIYQSYLGLQLSLMLVYYLKQMLSQRYDYKKLISNGLKYLSLIIVALALYLISVKFIFTVEILSYQGLDSMGQINISELPFLITNAYSQFFGFFFFDNSSQFGFALYLNYIILIAALYLQIKILLSQNTKIINKLLSLLILLILPLAINIIYIIASKSSVGLRMLYSYVVIYIYLLVLIDHFDEDTIISNKYYNSRKIINLALWILVLSFAFINYRFYIVTNKVYMTLDIDSRNLQSYTTRLISRIEDKEFYTKGKRVVFFGYPDITTKFTDEYTTKDVLTSTLLSGKIPKNLNWRSYPLKYSAFPNRIDRIGINDLVTEDYKALENKIKSIPTYPNPNSVFEFEGKIYVKLVDY